MAKQSTKEVFSFKFDPETKIAFSKLCYEIGIPMSSAINALCREAVRKQRLSFNLRDEKESISNNNNSGDKATGEK